MAQERSNLENRDRIDPSDFTLGDVSDKETAQDRDEMELISTDDDTFDPGSPERGDMELAAEDDFPVEAEQIKGQIEETRNQMGETIDAIQDKLSFSNISEQVTEHVNNAVESAKGAVYDATIGKAANLMKNFTDDMSNNSIVRTAKNNPFPFILMGLGAGLLAYQSYTGKGNGGSRRLQFTGNRGQRFDSQRSMTEGQGGRTFGRGESTLNQARETLSGAKDTVSNAAGTAYEKVSGAVDTAYTGASDVANQAYNKVGELRSTAMEQYDYYIEENPLAVGAVALALGAAVGFAVPSTRYEGRLLGEYRQDLMDKAQTTASHLLDKTKEVVSEAGKSVSEQTRASLTEH